MKYVYWYEDKTYIYKRHVTKKRYSRYKKKRVSFVNNIPTLFGGMFV